MSTTNLQVRLLKNPQSRWIRTQIAIYFFDKNLFRLTNCYKYGIYLYIIRFMLWIDHDDGIFIIFSNNNHLHRDCDVGP